MRAARRRLIAIALAVAVATAGIVACAGPTPGSPAAATRQGAPTATVATPTPTTTATSPTAASSPVAMESADGVVRIPLSGAGAIGIAVRGDSAWVMAHDDGRLIEVDLAGRREVAPFEVGEAATIVALVGNEVAIGRYAATDGRHLELLDPTTGTIRGIATGPIGGVASAADGGLWALEQTGGVLRIDPVEGAIVGRAHAGVGPAEHIDIVAADDGSAWVGSDNIAIWHVGTEPPTVLAEIDVGGGIPLATWDGLVWGARADELWAIDPATGDVARRVPLAGLIEILALDVDDGEAWIAARKPGRVGAVVGVDLETGAVIGDVPVALPAGVAIAGDRVWVTDAMGTDLVGIPR